MLILRQTWAAVPCSLAVIPGSVGMSDSRCTLSLFLADAEENASSFTESIEAVNSCASCRTERYFAP